MSAHRNPSQERVVCGLATIIFLVTAAPECGGEIRPCGASQTCNGECANVVSDPNNCGACGVVCPEGTVCHAGSCETSCGGGTTLCGDGAGGYCANLVSDNINCGACGHACAAGHRCAGSTCVPDCAPPTVACGDACSDLTTDSANCGKCGAACQQGLSCHAGFCLTVVAAGQHVTSNLALDASKPPNLVWGDTFGVFTCPTDSCPVPGPMYPITGVSFVAFNDHNGVVFGAEHEIVGSIDSWMSNTLTQLVSAPMSTLMHYAFDGQNVYWSDGDYIYDEPISGGQAQTLVSAHPQRMFTIGGTLFWDDLWTNTTLACTIADCSGTQNTYLTYGGFGGGWCNFVCV
jgi:hypothetical protein